MSCRSFPCSNHYPPHSLSAEVDSQLASISIAPVHPMHRCQSNNLVPENNFHRLLHSWVLKSCRPPCCSFGCSTPHHCCNSSHQIDSPSCRWSDRFRHRRRHPRSSRRSPDKHHQGPSKRHQSHSGLFARCRPPSNIPPDRQSGSPPRQVDTPDRDRFRNGHHRSCESSNPSFHRSPPLVSGTIHRHKAPRGRRSCSNPVLLHRTFHQGCSLVGRSAASLRFERRTCLSNTHQRPYRLSLEGHTGRFQTERIVHLHIAQSSIRCWRCRLCHSNCILFQCTGLIHIAQSNIGSPLCSLHRCVRSSVCYTARCRKYRRSTRSR